jgi:Glycosyltransferases involved in cell wall biogenesis
MDKLSAYILTRNSQRYLHEILTKLCQIADEIVVLDSGSTDSTAQIVSEFPQSTFHYRAFDNFKNQRNSAISLCSNDFVLFVDSDEIPDQQLLDSIAYVKALGFQYDAYEVSRPWMVMGKQIHCIYPVKTPDSPIRLINKRYVSFDNSSLVHESPSGYRSISKIDGQLWHHTFHSSEELYSKLDFYTDIAAQDIILNNKQLSWLGIYIRSLIIFVKWYLINGGYKDGRIGMILAVFAYRNVSLKYKKARLQVKL